MSQVGDCPMTVTFDESVLPKHLADIIATFARWADEEIDARCRADVVDSPVYHYTTRAGLEGILEGGFIRLSHLGEMRDGEEFLYGRNLARDAMSALFSNALDEISGNDTNLAAHAQRFFCEGTLSMLDEISPVTGPFEFYSASFCGCGDDAFFWREYADRGAGFALKLAPVLFADPAPDTPLKVMDKVFRIAMFYNRDNATTILRSGVREAVRAVRDAKLSPDAIVATTFWHAMSVRLLNYVIKIASGFKKPCFAPEREIRLLLLNEAKTLGPLSTTASNGRRYIRYDFTPPLRSPGVLYEITIGPCAPVDAEEWVSRLLLDHGYPTRPDGRPLTLIRRSSLR
jgi:hypothetical protein